MLLRVHIGLLRAASVGFGLAEARVEAVGTTSGKTLRPFVGIGSLEAFSERLSGHYAAVLELRFGIIEGAAESLRFFGFAGDFGCRP